MTLTSSPPVCFKCKHFDIDKVFCPAFPGPDGIPDSIIYDGNKHRRPLPGQGNNIVFEPMTPKKRE